MKKEREYIYRVILYLVGQYYVKGKIGCGLVIYIGRCNCVDDGIYYENT